MKYNREGLSWKLAISPFCRVPKNVIIYSVARRFRDAKEKSIFCAKVAQEKKAYDLVILDLKEFPTLTNYFFICSGRSDRQVQSIARSIEERMAERGIKPLGVEGMGEGRWVLLDYDDLVVHVFYEPVRLYYDLEGLWIEAPRVPLPQGEDNDHEEKEE